MDTACIMRAVKAGIDPQLLVSQVRNTAAWLWEDERAKAVTGVLDRVEEAEKDRTGLGYFRLMLASHFATVATFVPTDVDARIRHHVWAAMETPEEIAAAIDVVDEVARWDTRWVSARTVDVDGWPMSGHDGEWFSVRAGALGRAAVLGFQDLADRLVVDIDRELDRESGAFEEALRGGAPGKRVLAIATILAHNLGDLSRVVEQWPQRPEVERIRRKYTRLGHPEAEDKRFLRAAHLNKAIMALENHRFLPLRKPRALRTSRSLLLPIGPWFDAWGETVARELEDERDRAEVVTALLELHLSSPDQQGCLRALAGIHRATKGGLGTYAHELPARIRKEATRGRVREALDVAPAVFEARIEHRYKTEREVR